MTALVYLGLVVVLSVAGSLVLWLRTRERHSDDSVEAFARGMQALAPDRDRTRGAGRRSSPRPPRWRS